MGYISSFQPTFSNIMIATLLLLLASGIRELWRLISGGIACLETRRSARQRFFDRNAGWRGFIVSIAADGSHHLQGADYPIAQHADLFNFASTLSPAFKNSAGLRENQPHSGCPLR